jgi:hypothetical protein
MNPKSIAAPAADTQHFPAELRARPQWALAGDDKSPMMINGRRASVTDQATWTTYEAVCAAAKPGQFIGYMISPDDPFACIDLDVKDYTTPEQIERFQRIVACFDSYTEWSRSGRGLHIWVEGKIGKGRKREGVEVYSQARFIVCTGNPHLQKPIAQRQRYLEILRAELTRGTQIEIELEDDDPDADPHYAVAQTAFEDEGELGRLFKANVSDAWVGKYTSASEADIALVTMLAKLTTSNTSCWGAFQMSRLGKREKDGKVKSERADYRRTTLTQARMYLANDAVKKAHGQEIADALFFRIAIPAATVAGALTAKPLRKFLEEYTVAEFLVEDIFRRGWLYTVTGTTGAGKTGVAVYLCLMIAAGAPLNGKLVQKGPVLYIAGENPDDVRGRFKAALQHLPWALDCIDNIHIVDQSFLLKDRVADLNQLQSTLKPVTVFVDTDQAVSLSAEGNDNANNERMAHAKRLRQISGHETRPTVIDLCHPNISSSKGAPDRLWPRGGSSFISEIDGNVRCYRDEPNTVLAYDLDKWRGMPFEMHFRKTDVEVQTYLNQHGKALTLPVFSLAPDTEVIYDGINAYSERMLLLRAIAKYPQANQTALLDVVGWKTKAGLPDKPKISRWFKKLRDEDPPLIGVNSGLTNAGKEAAKSV